MILYRFFEHAYDLNKTFKEFNRTLKNKGKLILRWRSDTLLGSPLEYYNQITYRYFSQYSLKNLFKKYKFKFLFNESKNKIEGYDTYEYIICEKTSGKIKIKFSSQNNKKFLNQTMVYNQKYFKICLKANSLSSKLNYLKNEFYQKIS